jgi:catechol 2,3-dioxygenase-like lactoylglutathione lyase family enzyme
MKLDHIVLVATRLEEGVDYVREILGVELTRGGMHPELGTHNRLLRLGGERYLEVIAVNPEAPVPSDPRCFGLDDAEAVRQAWEEGRRLRSWVARVTQDSDLDTVLAIHGPLLGQARNVSRGGHRWRMSIRDDGAPPLEGAAPTAVEYAEGWIPGFDLPDLGFRLERFVVRHPEPEKLNDLYARLGLEAAPEVERGAHPELIAHISTPGGAVVELR